MADKNPEKLDWREVFKAQLAACQTWAEKEQLMQEVKDFQDEWAPKLFAAEEPLSSEAIQNWINNKEKDLKSAKLIIGHPGLTRELANPMFDWASSHFGIWWLEDVRLGLLERFVVSSKDPWWHDLWDLAASWDSIFEDSNPSETEDLKEEWRRLMGRLVEVPDISDEDIDGLSSMGLEDDELVATILLNPGLSEEAVLNSLTDMKSHALGAFREVLTSYIGEISRRKKLGYKKVLEFVIDNLGNVKGEEAIYTFLTKAQDFEQAMRLEAILEVEKVQPDVLARWLGANKDGALVEYIKDWPKDMWNKLLSSQSKDLRIAAAASLAKRESAKEEVKETGKPKMGR